MGDTGSQFLGAFLSGMSIVYLWQFRADTGEYFQIKQFLLPVLAFIVPIIDTTTVFVRRLLRRQSPFVGGRDHTTHHLVYLGLSDGQVSAFLLAISLLSVAIIYFIAQVVNSWTFTYSMVVLLYILLMFIIFQWMYNKGKQRHERNKLKHE